MGVKPPDLPERTDAVAIPEELLQSYVGEYHFALAGATITVSHNKGRLMVKMPKTEEPQHTFSLAEERFLVGGSGLEVSIVSEEEKVAALVLDFGGREFTCPRIESAE